MGGPEEKIGDDLRDAWHPGVGRDYPFSGSVLGGDKGRLPLSGLYDGGAGLNPVSGGPLLCDASNLSPSFSSQFGL